MKIGDWVKLKDSSGFEEPVPLGLIFGIKFDELTIEWGRADIPRKMHTSKVVVVQLTRLPFKVRDTVRYKKDYTRLECVSLGNYSNLTATVIKISEDNLTMTILWENGITANKMRADIFEKVR